jgi:hypothetical protein
MEFLRLRDGLFVGLDEGREGELTLSSKIEPTIDKPAVLTMSTAASGNESLFFFTNPSVT